MSEDIGPTFTIGSTTIVVRHVTHWTIKHTGIAATNVAIGVGAGKELSYEGDAAVLAYTALRAAIPAARVDALEPKSAPRGPERQPQAPQDRHFGGPRSPGKNRP